MDYIPFVPCFVGCDERECLKSHKIPVTYYIQTGKVLVPVITWVDYCDEYASTLGTQPPHER